MCHEYQQEILKGNFGPTGYLLVFSLSSPENQYENNSKAKGAKNLQPPPLGTCSNGTTVTNKLMTSVFILQVRHEGVQKTLGPLLGNPPPDHPHKKLVTHTLDYK